MFIAAVSLNFISKINKMKKIFICALLVLNFNLFAQVSISEPTIIYKTPKLKPYSENVDIGFRLGVSLMTMTSANYGEIKYSTSLFPELSVFRTSKMKSGLKFIMELKPGVVSTSISAGLLLSPSSNYSINMSPYFAVQYLAGIDFGLNLDIAYLIKEKHLIYIRTSIGTIDRIKDNVTEKPVAFGFAYILY